MRSRAIVRLGLLGLLVLGGLGCRKSTGSHSFSFTFNNEQQGALDTAVKLHDALCQALEKRGFRQTNVTETTAMKTTQYEGEHQGFPLTVTMQYRFSVSAEDPEFAYRVTFAETKAVDQLNKAAGDLRAVMRAWCDPKHVEQPSAGG